MAAELDMSDLLGDSGAKDSEEAIIIVEDSLASQLKLSEDQMKGLATVKDVVLIADQLQMNLKRNMERLLMECSI